MSCSKSTILLVKLMTVRPINLFDIVIICMKKENKINLSLAEHTENAEFFILFFAMNYETA